MLCRLPYRSVLVANWIPAIGQLVTAEEARPATGGLEDPSLDYCRHGEVHGNGELFSDAIGSFVAVELREPMDRPPCLAIELGLLLAQDFVQHLIDEAKRGSHTHRRVVGFDDRGV